MQESIIMSVGDYVSHAMTEAQDVANSPTYPVFINASNKKPDLIASSVAIQHRGRFFLVTAAHVLDKVKKDRSSFYIGLEGRFVAIESQFIRSVNASGDNFDIAFTELSIAFMSEHKIKFVVEENVLFGRGFETFHLAFIHGYPCSRNKQYKALLCSYNFKSHAFSYAGKIDKALASLASCRKSEDLHICMKYGKAKGVKGVVVKPPEPYGISGGGLWIMPDSFKPEELYLAGIAIEYHKRPGLVFSTKIVRVIEFIERAA